MARLDLTALRPTTPTGLVAFPAVGVISLVWVAANLTDKYEVYWNSTNTTTGAVKQATVTAASYVDADGLTTADDNYYWVRSVNQYGVKSLFSTGTGQVKTSGLTATDVNFNTPTVDTSVTVNDYNLSVGGNYSISNNGNLTFDNNGTTTFRNNGGIQFTGNGPITLANNSHVTFDNIGHIMFTNNGDFSIADINGSFIVSTATAGSTGAVTQNMKISGIVKAAASTTSLVVTNSYVSTSSRIFAVARTNDSTGFVKSVVCASGSFTINYAAPTSTMDISWFLLN